MIKEEREGINFDGKKNSQAGRRGGGRAEGGKAGGVGGGGNGIFFLKRHLKRVASLFICWKRAVGDNLVNSGMITRGDGAATAAVMRPNAPMACQFDLFIPFFSPFFFWPCIYSALIFQ